MPFFNGFPYSDYDQINLDWVIKTCKEAIDAALEAKTTANSANNTAGEAKNIAEQTKAYVDNYFNNLDVQNEINIKLEEMKTSGELSELINPYIDELVADVMAGIPAQIASITSQWLADNITQPTIPAVDQSLLVSGAAADAAVTGFRFDNISEPANLLDMRKLADFTSWAYDPVNDEYYGPMTGSKVIRINWKANTAYTVSIKAKRLSGTTTTGLGLRLNFYYTDSSYTRGAQYNNSDTSYGDTKYLTSDPTKTIDFLSISYAVGADNIWAIKEMMLNEGYLGYEFTSKILTAVDDVSRHAGGGMVAFPDAKLVTGIVSDYARKTVSGAAYDSVQIPNPGGAIKIAGNPAYATTITFATADMDLIPTGGAIPLAAGETGRHDIYRSTTQFLPIPDGCTHIIIARNRNDNRADPSELVIYPQGSLENMAITAGNIKGTQDIVDLSYAWVKGGYISSNSSTVNWSSPTSDSYMGYAVIPCAPGDRFNIRCLGSGGARRWVFLDASDTVITRDIYNPSGQYKNQWTRIAEVTAPPRAVRLICNHNFHHVTDGGVQIDDFGYSPTIFKLSPTPMINYEAKITGVIPSLPWPDWKRNVVAAFEKIIVININGVMYRSLDCGATWSDPLDVSAEGKLINYHLYANGCLGFFSVKKAFYTEDFITYTEAAVYEADGTTPYVPMDNYNFNTTSDELTRKYVGGQDLYVFGNYILTRKSQVPSVRVLLFCSNDNGHTYRIVYEFGENGNFFIRHVHWVQYYEPADKFIICTGDRDVEDYVLAATYSSSPGEWFVESLSNPGALPTDPGDRNYKWSSIAEWNGWLYYTHDVTPGAVKRCKYADIADMTKHETVLDSLPADPTGAFIGLSGEMIVTVSNSHSVGSGTDDATLGKYTECRRIYYSSDRKSFSSMFVPPQRLDTYTLPWRVCSLTHDGHIIIGSAGDTSNSQEIEGTTPSIYLDEIVQQTYPQAFRKP